MNSIDSWVFEDDQQTEHMPEIGINSFEIGGGLVCGLFEDDGYTSLAMLCQECSDGDDDNNDNDDDDNDDADDAPGFRKQVCPPFSGRANCILAASGGASYGRRSRFRPDGGYGGEAIGGWR